MPGNLTALTRSALNLGRFRSASYFLLHAFQESAYRTLVRRADNPYHATKEYLASFVGRNCLPLRGRLLAIKWQRKDVFIRDTTHSFNIFTHQAAGKAAE